MIETPRRIETLEEVAIVVGQELQLVRRSLGSQQGAISTNTEWGNEHIPDSRHRGLVSRGLCETLNGLEIPGMKPNDALQKALSSVLGEPQEIPEDAAEQDLYAVELDFAFADRIPTLRVGKIERHDDAVGALLKADENALASLNKPVVHWNKYCIIEYLQGCIAAGGEHVELASRLLEYIQKTPMAEYDSRILFSLPGNVRITDNVSAAGHFKRKLTMRDKIVAAVAEYHSLLQKPESEKPRHLVWHAGVTDMTYQHQIFALGEPHEGMKVHLMGGPKAPSMVFRKERNPAEKEGLIHIIRRGARKILGTEAVA